MTRCKMDQLVRWGNGEVATPRAMLDQGKAEVRFVERFAATSKSKPRRAVFVDLIGTMNGVEVSGYVQPSVTKNGKDRKANHEPKGAMI